MYMSSKDCAGLVLKTTHAVVRLGRLGFVLASLEHGALPVEHVLVLHMLGLPLRMEGLVQRFETSAVGSSRELKNGHTYIYIRTHITCFVLRNPFLASQLYLWASCGLSTLAGA